MVRICYVEWFEFEPNWCYWWREIVRCGEKPRTKWPGKGIHLTWPIVIHIFSHSHITSGRKHLSIFVIIWVCSFGSIIDQKKLRNMGYVQCYSKLSIVALHLQYASVSHATYIRYWSRIVTYNGQSSVSYETALTLIKAEMIIYCRIIKCVFALTSHKMMKINEQDRHALCTHTHTH